MTIVCGDSHTSTHGAFGALAFGIGTSRGRARAGDPDAGAEAPEDDAGRRRGRAAAGRHGQGRDPRHHRQDRHRRRHRLRDRVRRPGHPRPLDGRPHDGLQHVDRGRRARRPDRAGRDDLRLPRGPPAGAEGRRLGAGAGQYWRTLPTDEGADFDTEVDARRGGHRAAGHLGHLARRTWCRSPAACPTRKAATSEDRRRCHGAGAAYMGLEPDTPLERGPGRHASSSAPAPTAASRTCGPPPRWSRGRKVAPTVEAMVVPGSGLVKHAGRGGRAGQDLQRGGLRMARGRAARCASA